MPAIDVAVELNECAAAARHGRIEASHLRQRSSAIAKDSIEKLTRLVIVAEEGNFIAIRTHAAEALKSCCPSKWRRGVGDPRHVCCAPQIDPPVLVVATIKTDIRSADGIAEKILEFGSSISKHHGKIPDDVYNATATQFNKKDMIILIAFAGQMIATNVFSNVTETDIDEYLFDYLPPIK